ncbi:hypothetical protein [Arthrobacter woluwensis]|uniref:hypothetical protein n=1 Tax=Arthrobacter woluwensis TaxID=156980 RepID=UPI001AAEBE72|nr:hypothetical protein [Arthrobacter woluwensis]QTF73197.1 hypothetical protein G8758_15185 [Arthrobacter woluwensis]
MVVSKDFLREVFEVLLERAANGSEVVDLGEDYFWSIPPTSQTDVNADPDLTVGQYSECLEHLESVVEDPENAIGYSLVWLADVLRAVGAQEVG